jgi:hypothetical protein
MFTLKNKQTNKQTNPNKQRKQADLEREMQNSLIG